MDAQRGIARRMVVGLPAGGITTEWERDFAAYAPAGVILFRRDFDSLEALRRLTARLREAAGPRRVFIAIDEEGGFVSQLGGLLTVPPNAALLARGAAPGDIQWASRVTGERLRALGVDWAFAPVADVHSQPANPVIGPRSFGATAAAVAGAVGEALIGFEAAGIASCAKHFPGHGDTETDSHLALPTCRADRATLERRELPPFLTAPQADAVMTAHVVYPALDPERPATFSRAIVHDLLRERLGFRGVCITDALEMRAASGEGGLEEAARRALEAGCDLLLFAFHGEEIRRARLTLAKALVDGQIDRGSFDGARPRLEAFDRRRPEPTAAELARPLDSLTPPDWEARLERIVERGIAVREGERTLPGGAIEVIEPEWPYGPSIADELRALGMSGGPGAPAAFRAIASRVPVADARIEELRVACRSRPTALAAFAADAFLEAVPEAALRISALDATPLTRRAVARRIAAYARAGLRSKARAQGGEGATSESYPKDTSQRGATEPTQ
jgi:beta-N-acetylhexosaminidase